MSLMRSHLNAVILPFLTLVMAAQQTSAQAQEFMRPQAEEVFTAGFDDQLFFGFVTALAITDDGRLVVYDSQPGEGPAVTVFSPDGNVITRWGRIGEGPGELTGGPAALAIEGDTVLVAGPVGRVGFFTFAGDELARAIVPPGLFWRASLLNGDVVAWRIAPSTTQGSLGFEAVFGSGDGERTWGTRTLSGITLGSSLKAPPLLATLPGKRVVVGFGDEYSLYVISAESGDTLGLLARDVQRRSQADTEAFLERALHYSANPEEAPEAWSSLVDPWVAGQPGLAGYDNPLPLIRNIFWGPPGVLWVERALGLDDDYAGPLDRPDDSRLWDIIAIDDDHGGEYLGPLALPMEFSPLVGNSEFVAGIVLDRLGRQGVRVLRLTTMRGS